MEYWKVFLLVNSKELSLAVMMVPLMVVRRECRLELKMVGM